MPSKLIVRPSKSRGQGTSTPHPSHKQNKCERLSLMQAFTLIATLKKIGAVAGGAALGTLALGPIGLILGGGIGKHILYYHTLFHITNGIIILCIKYEH